MIEIRWFWHNWNAWEFVNVKGHDGSGMYVLYLGCLVLAWHHE